MSAEVARALITGSTGFVGKAVATFFQEAGWATAGLTRRVHGAGDVACDLAVDPINPILEAHRPDVVIHCAGSSIVRGSFENRDGDFTDNVLAVQRLLSAVRETVPTSTVVLCSSAAALGGGTLDRPLPPDSPYGLHKLMTELIASDYARNSALDVRVARIYSAYGPGLKRQVVYDFCRQAVETNRIRAMGTGHELRDFVFIQDLGAILASVALTDHLEPGAVVEVGSGNPVSIADVADMVARHLGGGISIEFTGASDSNSIPEMRADVTQLTRVHRSVPTSIEDGISRTADWVRDGAH